MKPATLVSAAGAAPWEASLVGSLLARHSGVQVLARCFDVAQVLAAVERVTPDVVLVGHDLAALDREVIARLRAHCGAVVGAYPANDHSAVRHLIDIGCERAVPHDLDALDLARLVRELAGEPTTLDGGQARSGGKVIAVWGPAGGPGRTTIACGLAAAIAGDHGRSCLLADVDTYGPGVAQSLGLPERPSLLSALRVAAAGRFEGPDLRAHCQDLEGLAVLAGPPSANRWPDVREASLKTLIEAAREEFEITVLDTGFNLEEDEELSYSGAPLRRNLAARVALGGADLVVGVCRADPIGLRRFLAARPDLDDITAAPVETVLNRVGASTNGARRMDMSLLLERRIKRAPAVFVPDDASVGDSLWEGLTVVRGRPRSGAARALRELSRLVLAGVAENQAAKSAADRYVLGVEA